MYRMPPRDSEAFRLMGDPAHVAATLDPKRRGELLSLPEAVRMAQASIESAPPPRPTAIVVMAQQLAFVGGKPASPHGVPDGVDIVLALVGRSNYRVLHNFSRDPDGKRLNGFGRGDAGVLPIV